MTQLEKELLDALKELRRYYGKPEHANTAGQAKAMRKAEALIAKAS